LDEGATGTPAAETIAFAQILFKEAA